MAENINKITSFVYGIHGTVEERNFVSVAQQSNLKYQVSKPINVECELGEEYFGEEWVPTPDLWTPLCGCGECGGSETGSTASNENGDNEEPGNGDNTDPSATGSTQTDEP